MLNLTSLLTKLAQQKGSDLHLKINAPPIMRKNSMLSVLQPDIPPLTSEQMQSIIKPVLNEANIEKLKNTGSVDIGYGVKNVGRFRLNVFFQRGSLRLVSRYIPSSIPSFEELNLPAKNIIQIIENNIETGGMILVTGATGTGKSTTLAGIINHINKTYNKHILTLEDPIEFLIRDYHSLITQVELGVDCHDPVVALKSALRQDPDIILFSELRLADIISTSLKLAETGHLVLSTLHTQDAAETINRIINSLPPNHQEITRSILSQTLKAVISQRLLTKKEGEGLIPATEILINSPQVRKAIQDKASTEEIRTIMKKSKTHWGMHTFDYSLIKLLKNNLISEKEALSYSSSPENIKATLAGVQNQDISWMQSEEAENPIPIKKPA